MKEIDYELLGKRREKVLRLRRETEEEQHRGECNSKDISCRLCHEHSHCLITTEDKWEYEHERNEQNAAVQFAVA